MAQPDFNRQPEVIKARTADHSRMIVTREWDLVDLCGCRHSHTSPLRAQPVLRRGAEHGKRSGGVLVAQACGPGGVPCCFRHLNSTDLGPRRRSAEERTGPEVRSSAFAFPSRSQKMNISGMVHGVRTRSTDSDKLWCKVELVSNAG
jgi:hypothetical protein